MRTVTSFPYETQETEHLWIEMSDGVRLAARLWRPVSADDSGGAPASDDAPATDIEPVPGILELIPYRQRDLTAQRDSIHHPYMAGHGYACLRVDLRGSGNSEGVLSDEYLEQELVDAEEILAWMASQPWCSGRTAMMGISWGGFNALQVAARRPPSLGAIITCSSTDDRYTDDVHYMGGCLLTDNLSWASTMFAYNACPPDPAIVGDAWRQMWLDRLRGSGLWLETWLRHQRRDDYWRHGSIIEDYSAVEVPVLAVSGWADGYSNSVFRLLANLDSPVRGLIGPWSHKYPHLGEPGPAIGFLQEAVLWWDHWLKDDRGNGAMDRPALTIWMQDTAPPATTYAQRPGRWVGEESWPTRNVVPTRFPLGFYTIHAPGEESHSTDPRSVRSPLSVGQFAGKWCSYNAPPDMPYDQREEDGGSLVFTSAALPETVEVLGAPVVSLDLSVDQPSAQVIVRLSDVAPDGEATRVSYEVQNLTHHAGSAEPVALVPGERRTVDVQLNGMAQSFPPGHQLRVSVSTSYWPVVWPSPEPVRMTIHPRSSELLLPVRPRPPHEISPVFGEAEGAEPLRARQLVSGAQDWRVSRDMVDLSGRLDVVKDLGTVHFEDIDLAVRRASHETYGFVAGDVSSVRGETLWNIGFSRGDWSARTTTRTVLTSTATEFHVYAEQDAWEGHERVDSRTWSTSIPRDHV
ncbi:CocE/NonD family hydrolase [Brachybacterium sp. FME24]|uniref:CocE/NonD family hydrolase n=1 Tax=Brachybacterium sp. FME24 TaxID=2742605 RepID=UPI0018662B11|nr:CocE/NonD family hydrolase [Brachybacterium sp. FME24]